MFLTLAICADPAGSKCAKLTRPSKSGRLGSLSAAVGVRDQGTSTGFDHSNVLLDARSGDRFSFVGRVSAWIGSSLQTEPIVALVGASSLLALGLFADRARAKEGIVGTQP